MIRRAQTLILIVSSALALGAAPPPVESPVPGQDRNPLLSSFEQYSKMKRETPFGLNWVPLGPVMNSSRVGAVQGVPGNPAVLYAAVGSGSLWKSTNGGLTWSSIFDDQPSLGIGDFALAPSNPNIIWLGGGVDLKKPRNFTMPGAGVFRSDDGGATWTHRGLSEAWHIGEVAIHPENPDIVFAAVMGRFWTPNPERGVYRTLDGGAIWTRVLHVDERTGAADVIFAPSNPDILYASTWENHPDVAGPGSGVHKSADGGRTWTRLRGGLPDGPRTGRIGLAVSRTNPDKVYALVDNLNKDKNLAAELYRTADGGRTWTRTHADELLIYPGIGWYFGDCNVDPRDDDEVYALGVRIAHSRDGGRSFELVGGDVLHLFPNPAEVLHLDHCEMWIDPLNPDRLILGNDGGLYSSFDRGRSWLHHNAIPSGEFYDIDVDKATPYNVYAGAQDDASVFGPAREWDPRFPDGWSYVWLDAWAGGDGCYTVPDPEDPDTVYFSSQNGAIRRKSVSAGRSVPIRPRLPKDHGGTLAYNFITPYILSPHNHLTLYHAGNFIFKSLNRGNDWTLISPDLSRSANPAKRSVSAGAVAESPLRPGLLYVGTDKGAFWATGNDGAGWEERSDGLPDRYIRSICPSRFAESRVYLTVSGLDSDDLAPYVFVSEDSGKRWTPISAGLPEQVAYTILEDPVNENLLYLGMSRGVYLSTDRGGSWALLGRDLPAAAVSDLVIQEREMDLVAGTYGRGIYRTNLRPLQEAFRNGAPAADTLFAIPSARLPWINDTHRDPRLSTTERVPITFYSRNAGTALLRLEDKDGKEIWSRPFDAGKGFNQLRWDLVAETVASPQPYFVQYRRYPVPGTYTLRITGEHLDLSGPMTILARERLDR